MSAPGRDPEMSQYQPYKENPVLEMRKLAELAHKLRTRRPCRKCGVLCQVCQQNHRCCLEKKGIP